MERQTYRTVEYGGRHSGSVSYTPTSDALVLDREDLVYVLKALRRGTESDRTFARKMFHTLLPVAHCACCGRRVMEENGRAFYGKTLCPGCEVALGDIEYCLSQTRYFPNCRTHPLEELASVQKARESWCPARINYLVTKDTYDRYLEKYNALSKTEVKK